MVGPLFFWVCLNDRSNNFYPKLFFQNDTRMMIRIPKKWTLILFHIIWGFYNTNNFFLKQDARLKGLAQGFRGGGQGVIGEGQGVW